MAVAQQLSHVYPIGSYLDERGRLHVGGCDVVEVARELGTPAYVVAEDDLRHRARAFKAAFGRLHDRTSLVFATKAFACTAVLRVFAEEGLGCDVASGGELALALRAGIAPEHLELVGDEAEGLAGRVRRASASYSRKVGWTTRTGRRVSSLRTRARPRAGDRRHNPGDSKHPQLDPCQLGHGQMFVLHSTFVPGHHQ